MKAAALLLLALLVAGCSGDPPEPARRSVDPPSGGGWADCPPSASRALAVPFRAAATNETGGKEAGIHRLDERRFLYVWATYEATLREDRITRVNPVELARDGAGVTHVCGRVDVATPTEVDAEPRSYALGVLLQADASLPEGAVRVTVNWVAGCDCDPLPRGNATALFDG